ncbi:MAG: hypothetical protein IT210_09710 [Armatimonadetes bacterium]|nr:hypothetical protein [Armatimonadota bacterium]
MAGAKGKRVAFLFTDGDIFGARGPCFSPDGSSWRWLGRKIVVENGFSFDFGEADGGWFAFCIPYTGQHLEAFLSARPADQRHLLTFSEKGRPVYRLAAPSRKGIQAVLVTVRAHTYKTMGSYALEGLIDFGLGSSSESVFLREHVDLHAVPFLDTDGVEEGDQGKNRSPHDHNGISRIPRSTPPPGRWVPSWVPSGIGWRCLWICTAPGSAAGTMKKSS